MNGRYFFFQFIAHIRVGFFQHLPDSFFFFIPHQRADRFGGNRIPCFLKTHPECFNHFVFVLYRGSGNIKYNQFYSHYFILCEINFLSASTGSELPFDEVVLCLQFSRVPRSLSLRHPSSGSSDRLPSWGRFQNPWLDRKSTRLNSSH